jgi:hypothetical protein
MIEGLMKKLGYVKASQEIAISKDQVMLLDLVKEASKKDDNIFIDYVKRKNKSTVYIKDSKTRKTKYRVDLFLGGF